MLKPRLLLALLLAGGCQGPAAFQPAGPVYRPPDGAIPLPVRPSSIICRDGRMYVGSFHDAQLLVLDEKTHQVLHRFDDFDRYTSTIDQCDPDGKVVGQRTESHPCPPGDMRLVGDRLIVGQCFSQRQLVFDVPTMHLIERAGSDGTYWICTSRDGRTACFPGDGQSAFIVRQAGGKSVAVPPIDNGRGLDHVALSPDGKRLYIAVQRRAREAGAQSPSPEAGPADPTKQLYSGPFLAVFDVKAEKYVKKTSIGDTLAVRGDDSSLANGLAFSDDGRLLYIPMGQCMAGVHVYDTAADRLLRPITFPSTHPSSPWPGCRHVYVRGDTMLVLLASNGELAILDLPSRKVTAVASLPGSGGGGFAVAGRRVYVGAHDLRRVYWLDIPSL